MQIQYKLVSMEVVSVDFFKDVFNKEKEEMNIHNSFSFGVDVSHHVLLCLHQISLQQEGKDFFAIQLNSLFALSPNSFNGMKKGKSLGIPQEFLVQCASISYGSMRGIVLLKAKENGLENIILPPAYMSDIIKSPMTVEL